MAFIHVMSAEYDSSDVVVTRAGAETCSELMNIGKPAILVPSPHVAGDHQTKNAASLARTGAAILLKEEMLETRFIRSIPGLIRDAAKLKRKHDERKRHANPTAARNIA